MPERVCPKCGAEGYENRMFMFFSFTCKKCGYHEDNMDTHKDQKDMTLREYYNLPDDV